MNRCANCGREITEDICPYCGTSNKIESCPVCGQHRIKNAPYCGNCGFAFWLSDRKRNSIGNKISRFILPFIILISFAVLAVMFFVNYIEVSSGGKLLASVNGYDFLTGNTSDFSNALIGVANVQLRITLYTVFSWVAVGLAVILLGIFVYACGKYTRASLILALVFSVMVTLLVLSALIDYLIIKSTISSGYEVRSILLIILFAVAFFAVLVNIASLIMFNPTIRTKKTVVSKNVKFFPKKTASNFSNYIYDHKAVTIIILLVILLIIGGFTTLFIMMGTSNVKPVPKDDFTMVEQIVYGQSKEEIRAILGTPKHAESEYYEYYGANYLEKCVAPTLEKNYWHIENVSDVENMHYDFIKIGFNEEGKVVSVIMDKDHKYTENGFASWTKKSVKEFSIGTPVVDNLGFLMEGKTEYSIKYSDGSYIKGYIENISYGNDFATQIGGKIQYTFENVFGEIKSSVTTSKITVVENQLLAVDSTVSGEVILPSFITKIGNNAFGDNAGITKITINKGIKEIGANFIGNCPSLEKLVFEDVIDWYYSSTPNGAVSYAIAEESLSEAAALNTVKGIIGNYLFKA